MSSPEPNRRLQWPLPRYSLSVAVYLLLALLFARYVVNAGITAPRPSTRRP